MTSLFRGFDGDSNEEETYTNSFVSSEDVQFDTIVGHIEDILIDQDFQCLQRSFLQKYCLVFTRDEENKLEYMEIFREYTTLIEAYIEEQLRRLIPSFSMQSFISQLERRKNEIEGEVFELLISFSDFLAFKELILDHRAMQEGEINNLGDCIVVSSLNSAER
ncbi:ADP-ribosylation factor-like protein 2-binding protein [Ischnura elegans]|uniref:ADP-ribosylation factor-like protein 2-binding protein n=1 Tax=Ischnura elegans TaxID=197161 RepID=UPI001ED899FF|nr:ADP-ribosylation factor-like protein 2-binding protein [Ischnura elegans]